MINVTKTFLPPFAEYQAFLKRAWDKHWLTNRGELVVELETELKQFLGIKHITLTTNGTLPIQIAIKGLGLKGEIITTPFSYVATTSSIVWEGCTPVFVDIHPEYLTIDETKIEAAITSKTTAILATHVFGNPCHVEAIETIAKKHHLKVIYDAAHAFGVTYKHTSVFNFGDVSTCSFHATKLFHSGEGGCWVTQDQKLNEKLFYYHNFGHDGLGQFYDVGINGKMSELQAALGLAVLPYVNTLIAKRKQVYKKYLSLLEGFELNFIQIRKDVKWNFSYLPVIFKNEETLLKVEKALKNKKVNTRRYFYPSLNQLSYLHYKQDMPISEHISKCVLCLPLYDDLSFDNIQLIAETIKSCLE